MELYQLKIQRNEVLHKVNMLLRKSKWVKCPADITYIVVRLIELERELNQLDHIIVNYYKKGA